MTLDNVAYVAAGAFIWVSGIAVGVLVSVVIVLLGSLF